MIEKKQITVGELEFDCIVSGNAENELIIFLHGFPETSFMWRKLMEKLSSLGYYCLAPNLRGYSQNACPNGVKHYTVKLLREDILNIADVVGKEKFHLIAHDWGAVIGWNLVYKNHDRIISWSSLSAPHSNALRKALKLHKEQRKKISYMKMLLLPFLPEIMLRKNDFQKFRRLWKYSSPEEIENYLSVFRRKPSLSAALNYYRANVGRGKTERIGEIKAPTLFIWGKTDLAISSFAAEYNYEYMKGDYTFIALDGGHWLVQSNYSEVEHAIIEHISKY